MRRSRHRSSQLICGIDGTPFVSVMMSLAVTLLVVFMIGTPTFHWTIGLPRVKHPIPLWGAARQGALIVSVWPSGDVLLGNERIEPALLAEGIRERVNVGAKKKVYIRAYARVRYGAVKEVLDGVHAAGIEDIAFITQDLR